MDFTYHAGATQASALGRLRHPSILGTFCNRTLFEFVINSPHEEMVEPLEETRNELIFATEPILSSLQLSIPGSSRYSPLVELDEVEVRVL